MSESRIVKVEHESRRDGGLIQVVTSTTEEYKASHRYDHESHKSVLIPEDEQEWVLDDSPMTETLSAVILPDAHGTSHVEFIQRVYLYSQFDIDAVRQLLDDIEKSGVLANP